MQLIVLLVFSIIFISCNDAGKDSVEKADSANRAKLDSSLNQNEVVIDENSSAFLVRAAALVWEIGIVSDQYEDAKAKPAIRDLVHLTASNHKILSDSVNALAARKNIVLPVDSIASLAVINQFSDRETFSDKAIISYLKKTHEKAISLFENAVLDAKDSDIRSFADRTLPMLRSQLGSAKLLEKNF